MNLRLELLQPYPFAKIRVLLEGHQRAAGLEPISLTIGEPRHPAPPAVMEALCADLSGLERYPSTAGSDQLRGAIADWLIQRYRLNGDRDALQHSQVLPVNGTREALFAIAQTLLDPTERQRPHVLMPNPFYQIYEGAALLAGLTPKFYPVDDDADANLDAISDEDLAGAQLIYICNPGNPSGAVASKAALRRLYQRAREHRIIIVSDECYAELWRAEAGAPCGMLEAAAAEGAEDFRQVLVMHSLSKRSNLPGLRSGFVAGDSALMEAFQRYRTYHGVTMPLPVQQASTVAWQDEQHVEANRARYDRKYAAVVPILQQCIPVRTPPAGFYLWPDFGTDDAELTLKLHTEQALAVVPGQYLAREINGHNPGRQRLRLALVAPLEQCVEAAERIVRLLST